MPVLSITKPKGWGFYTQRVLFLVSQNWTLHKVRCLGTQY